MKWLQSKWWKRSGLAVLGVLLALIGYGLLQLIEPVSLAPISPSAPLQFIGRALLVASDADMVATAYADGQLDRVSGVNDALSVIPLPLNGSATEVNTVQASNSVMSWPQIIAVSPDASRAYVAEVRSQPADGVQAFETIDQMPEGQRITVVDIANLAQPTILESVEIGLNPEHLSISPDGRFLAVNLMEPGREFLIVRLQPDGRLGQRFYFPMPTDGTRQDNFAAIWHPSGQFLAMTQNRNREVGFYQLNETVAGEVTIAPYSEPLTVGNHLSNARFTADGRFLLVPDLKWRTHGLRLFNYLLNPKGEMIAIRFEPDSGQPPEIVSRVEVGLSPEGFTLSPDDSLIATVNLRRT